MDILRVLPRFLVWVLHHPSHVVQQEFSCCVICQGHHDLYIVHIQLLHVHSVLPMPISQW